LRCPCYFHVYGEGEQHYNYFFLSPNIFRDHVILSASQRGLILGSL
jgi:hypothetical protein